MPLEPVDESDSFLAYVLGAHGKPKSAVVINMNATDEARVSLANLSMKNARALRMSAAAPDSKSGVTFGGAQVDEAGRWKAVSSERISSGVITVPPMSAAVVLAAQPSNRTTP